MQPLFQFFESRLNPYPSNQIPLPRKGLLKFLWACTAGLRGWLVLFTFLVAVMGVYEAVLFAWIGDLVDWLNHYTPQTLWAEKGNNIKLMAIIMLASPLVVILQSLVHYQVIQAVFPMQMRWRFHRRMLGQSMQFYQDEFSGRVSAKVMQTALAVRAVIMTICDMLTYVFIYFLTAGVIMFSLDKLLLLPFILWLVLLIANIAFFIPKLRDASRKQADARSLMTGRITDAYANITTVKLFSHSRRELKYAKEAMQQFITTVYGQMRWVTYLGLMTHLISVVLVGSTAIISLYLWNASIVTAGAIATATAMAIRMNGMTHWIMWQMAQLFENIGTVQDGISTLSTPQTVLDKANAKKMTVNKGEISFNKVNFTYEVKDENKDKVLEKHLLKEFTLNIKPGEKVGLVGRSGAGKSTLVNLLLRFYDVQSGKILIDGQAIDDVTQESLRMQIGMVTQDTSLLHRTVRENIAYGRPDASEDEIIAAAKKAHAWDFIQDLHDKKGNTGLDTKVGERGVKLSGGQRQRIAIARVMLKNAPILLLDEATSALDSEIEHAITESLNDMMAGKTVIAIAHRLSTIAALDKLIVIEEGKIVEQGSHEQLLALDGIYAKLWQRQSGGFLGEE
ncbi:MAG: multidrug ABC transporter ATP-binding protein [Gammaproteobacteria bacterium]|nr:MAG: multidrug ABC transporter ATP-binding protein [Gammaproteobacteria bacterium]